jgi:hypothetical protein
MWCSHSRLIDERALYRHSYTLVATGKGTLKTLKFGRFGSGGAGPLQARANYYY